MCCPQLLQFFLMPSLGGDTAWRMSHSKDRLDPQALDVLWENSTWVYKLLI